MHKQQEHGKSKQVTCALLEPSYTAVGDKFVLVAVGAKTAGELDGVADWHASLTHQNVGAQEITSETIAASSDESIADESCCHSDELCFAPNDMSNQACIKYMPVNAFVSSAALWHTCVA